MTATANKRFPVHVDDKFGFINIEGDIVIPPQFDLAGAFHEGLAEVIRFDADRTVDPRPGEISENLDLSTHSARSLFRINIPLHGDTRKGAPLCKSGRSGDTWIAKAG